MKYTEADIIKGCIKGERSCQKSLYEHFASKMLGVCMRYAKDKSEAEDMLQEGFLKVFLNINKFKNEGSFEGWVRRIMIFTAINVYKYRLRKYKEDFDHEEHDAPYNDGIIDKISAKEIMMLMHQMPEGYKVIFNLYTVEGYTHKEIAKMLGIAEGTSKSQYSRARQFLQQALAKHYQILNEPFQEP